MRTEPPCLREVRGHGASADRALPGQAGDRARRALRAVAEERDLRAAAAGDAVRGVWRSGAGWDVSRRGKIILGSQRIVRTLLGAQRMCPKYRIILESSYFVVFSLLLRLR